MHTTLDIGLDTGNPAVFDDENESKASMWLKRALIALVALSLLAGIGYGIKSLMSGGAPQKKQVTTIKLIPDIPPPPPPPPPKEPPKEQPKPDAPKEVKIEQPKPVETPPAEQIKMEGPAGDGPSAFAAGAVNNDYKGGEVKTIGSDGGAKFNWYADTVNQKIVDAIQNDSKLNVGQYEFTVKVWLKSSGSIEKFVIETGLSQEKQSDIKATLENMMLLREPPPEGMPQPIKLRITARKMG